MYSIVGCSQEQSEIEEPDKQLSCDNPSNEMGLDNGILNVKLDLILGGAKNKPPRPRA